MVRGGQPGNQNAAKGKPWTDAIKRALARAEDGSARSLNALAEKFLDACAEGDMAALKELGDRLDGKARQQTELSGADGQPLGIVLLPARNAVDADPSAG